MRIELKPGEQVTVCLHEADGEFVVKYGKNKLTITADMPDAEGREGVVYEERYGKHSLCTDWRR